MRYANNLATDGVTIDGIPDSIPEGTLRWETVNGAQGAMTIVHTLRTDIAGMTPARFYLDQRTPAATGPERQCTGDGAAYGASGPMTSQQLPNTDPKLGPANQFAATRTMFYDSPGKTAGPRREAEVAQPLRTAVSDWP
jgi:hypothetical protein